MFLSPALRTHIRTRLASRTSLRAFHASAQRNDIFEDANVETFRKATASKDKVVLVDFYADWCGPCRMLSPVLEKFADSSSDVKTGSGKALDLVTVDTDVEIELAKEFQVASLPTVIAFKDGKVVSQFVGAVPEGAVRKWLQSL